MAEAPVVANDKPIYPIGSVDSAMRLLLMIGERDRVRIAEAAKELGVARSTAHRLMQMLLYHGFVRQDPESKAYVAGPRLIGLGVQLVRKLDVRTIARPYMEALAAEVSETVHLFALQPERGVLCLDSVEGPRGLRVGARTGLYLPAFASASGRAILSTLPEEDVREMYRSPRLPKHEECTIGLRTELLERLDTARSLGYAVQRNESEPGVSAVSAPLRVGDGIASFAIAVALPTERLADEMLPSLGEAVCRCASEVSESLGL
jgi:IclR family acetate operon transcriptional repressor